MLVSTGCQATFEGRIETLSNDGQSVTDSEAFRRFAGCWACGEPLIHFRGAYQALSPSTSAQG